MHLSLLLLLTLLFCSKIQIFSRKIPVNGRLPMNKKKTRSTGTGSGALKSPQHHNVVIPIKKETLSTKLFKGLSKFTSTLRRTTESAAQSVSRANRDITAYFSSDFEVLLLKMTEPNDSMTTKKDLQRFIKTTKSFVYNGDLVSPSNTYRATLRKIWAKVAERDCRTVLKALYLLNLLFQKSSLKDAKLYQRLILKMSREYSKKSHSKYFSKVVTTTAAASTGRGIVNMLISKTHLPEEEMLDLYYSYVMKRGRECTGQFSELERIGLGIATSDALRRLNAAGRVIDAGLRCRVTADAAADSEIAVYCMELVAIDLAQLITLYADKAAFLIQEYEVSDIFEQFSEEETQKELDRLRTFYESRREQVCLFIAEAREHIELYRAPQVDSLELTPRLLEAETEPPEGTESTAAPTVSAAAVEAHEKGDTEQQGHNEQRSTWNTTKTKQTTAAAVHQQDPTSNDVWWRQD